MSTVTTARTSVEGFRHALARRLKNKASDSDCAALAEELLEEVRQLPENRATAAHWLIAAGFEAMEILQQKMWSLEKVGRSNASFPRARGVLFEAVLEGWESAFNSYGFKPTQDRFARFIARSLDGWDNKEREFALNKLREALKRVNPPIGWMMTCEFLAHSERTDDRDIIAVIGRSFGHFAGQANLFIAAKTIREVDPHWNRAPVPV